MFDALSCRGVEKGMGKGDPFESTVVDSQDLEIWVKVAKVDGYEQRCMLKESAYFRAKVCLPSSYLGVP